MFTDRSLAYTADRMVPVGQVLDEVFGDHGSAAESYWMPAFDLAERPGEYVLIVELPGVEPDAVDLSVEKNVLTVRGVKQPSFSEESNRDTRVYALERSTGPFSRVLRLPEHIESQHIEASFTNGILEVHIPKSSAAQGRKIPIRERERSAD